MSSECKFEIGRKYRNGHGEIFTIDQLDGDGSYEGVPMPVMGYNEHGSIQSFTVDGQYLHYQSTNDLIPEPIDDEPDEEIVELEAVDDEPESSTAIKLHVGGRYRRACGSETVIVHDDGDPRHCCFWSDDNYCYGDDGDCDNGDFLIVEYLRDEIAPGALVKPEQLELAREMCRNGAEFWVNAKSNNFDNWIGPAGWPIYGWMSALADNDRLWDDSRVHVRRGPKPAEPPRDTPTDEIIDVESEPAGAAEVIEAEPASLLPDSGERTEFDTGAERDASEGKGLPSCIPPTAIRSLALRFEDGASKYTRDNWLKGIPLSRYQDAIIRHTLAAAEGQTDEDHLGAVLWNAAAWIETERRINAGQLPQSLDDLTYRERHETQQVV